MLALPESGRAMRADRSCHPRAGRTAPDGIVVSRDTELPGMREDIADRPGHVRGSRAGAPAGAIGYHERVEAMGADLRGVWEALVNGGDVREPAARRDEGEGRPGPPGKEE